VTKLVKEYQVQKVLWERPEVYPYKGRRQMGIRTFLALGVALGAVLTVPGVEYIAVSPMMWKGRYPKERTLQWVHEEGYTTEDHNEADAIAMLLWYWERGERWLQAQAQAGTEVATERKTRKRRSSETV
jgi:hypothetical protein